MSGVYGLAESAGTYSEMAFRGADTSEEIFAEDAVSESFGRGGDLAGVFWGDGDDV